jgi:hypothetical protein
MVLMHVYKILVGKPQGKKPSKDLDIDENVILQWILEKQCGKWWIGLIWLGTGTNGGFL